jgi:hypothetical protein
VVAIGAPFASKVQREKNRVSIIVAADEELRGGDQSDIPVSDAPAFKGCKLLSFLSSLSSKYSGSFGFSVVSALSPAGQPLRSLSGQPEKRSILTVA